VSRAVVIAQARMGSSRLPGKVLEDLGGRPVVWHCLMRALKIPGVAAVCVATSDLAIDDPLADFCREMPGVVVVRGHPTDLLERYARSADETAADVIVRITCDCPLIDPEVCGATLALQRQRAAPYASNNLRREWPHGLDCEVFPRATLEAAVAQAQEPYDREHVGPWIKRAAGAQAVHLAGPDGDAACHRWTLDYPEDLQFLRALWPLLPEDRVARWFDVDAILRSRPDVAAINACHSISAAS